MPYKDRQKRNEAVWKSQAKKPEKYRLMRRDYKREASRKGYYITKRYGISIDDYEAIQAAQGDACAICKKPSGVTKSGRCNLHVDHCHTTKKVRGLLCARCNTLVGYIQTTPQSIMDEVHSYIEKNTSPS